MPQPQTPIGLPAFLACMRRHFFPPRGSATHFGRGRLLVTFVYLPLCLLLAGCHYIGFALDYVLFPAFRRVQVRKPLFVIGPPRSGTTFLHRLMSRDTAQFTSFTLGEMIFAPSITERKIFQLFGRIDSTFGRPVQRAWAAFEDRMFNSLTPMHRVSFFEPEEDFILFSYIFACPILIAGFPFPDVLGHLFKMDRETSPEQKHRMMQYYTRCVQRHLYFHGTDKRLFSKNPYFTPMLKSLQETFPDAHFLCNIRNPEESVPSMIGLWHGFYAYCDNDLEHYMGRDFVVDYMADFYAYAMARFNEMPPDRGRVILYEDLTQRLYETIHGIYEAFGIAISPEFDAFLRGEDTRARKYKSEHRYDLGKFGLDEEVVRERFAEVFERYTFEGTPPTRAAAEA
jgi:omega-hydroxy-beta-dihydromenaquinone-9 sulfotransferase